MNAKLHPREIAYALAHSGARMCFVSPDLSEKMSPLIDEVPTLQHLVVAGGKEYIPLFAETPIAAKPVDPEAPAWLFYTSGTTGRPKGATLSHRSLMAMMFRYYADVDELSEHDCMLHAAPLSHAGGLYALPHIAKASHNIIPESGGFDPAEIFALSNRYDNLTFFAVPTMLTRLIDHPGVGTANIDAIKTILYGGAPMYIEDLKRALARFGPKLIGIYGQGETPNTLTILSKRAHACINDPSREHRLSTVGIARTGIELRIVDEQGEDVAPGEIGEIVTRSDVCMSGYWNDAEATRKAVRNGWLHTGDMGCISDDGYLSLKDRSKDLIISGGSNIYPREVEEVLMLHPGVFEVSVVGRPHPDWGEEVVAFIVARDGCDVKSADLEQICLENIARFKRPKEYKFLSSLPKSDYGKVLKTELRRTFLA